MQAQIRRQRNRLENWKLRLRYLSPINQIQQKRTYSMDLEGRLTGSMNSALVQQRHRMALYAERFKGLSPLEKLSQGYAYVEDKDHKVINDVNSVKPEDMVRIYVKNGTIQAKVKEIDKVGYGEGTDT